MAAALALPAALWLALQAADLEVGLRTEGRTGEVSTRYGAASRTAVATVPLAALLVDGGATRWVLAYRPRIWSSDVERRPDPLVTHSAEARLEARAGERWRLRLGANGLQGESDPFQDPFQAAGPAGASLIAASTPIVYRVLGASAHADVEVSPRTNAGAGASWGDSRGLDATARAVLPVQHAASGDAYATYRLTERDTLRLSASGVRTWTAGPTGEVAGVAASASGGWRRRLSPIVDGWASAGAGFAWTDAPGGPPTRDVLPVAEAGIAVAGDPWRVRAEVSVRMTTYADRISGDQVPAAEGRGTLTWSATDRTTVTASVEERRRTDGQSSLGMTDLWLRWLARRSLTLELGVLGRWQREVRPELPSFSGVAVVGAVTYGAAGPTAIPR